MSKKQPGTDLDEADLHWLINHADEELGADLPDDPIRLITHFRKRHVPHRSSLLSELVELRQRGMAKFTRAASMFFTRLGLEQATDERLANYKADRFRPHTDVIDLCCGIGGDLLALAARGRVAAVDNNAQVLLFASANLRVHALDAELRCDDVRNIDVSRFGSWHLDPDRRPAGTKRSSPGNCEPSMSVIQRLLELNPSAAVKLSPAADTSSLDAPNVELEWLGHRRQCQQLVLWSGDMARHPGKRVATWLCETADGKPAAARLTEEDVEPAPVVHSVARFLYESKPSVLAAGLEDVLAARHGLSRPTPGIAYLCSDQLVANEPLLSAFEILENVPMRRQDLRQRLAALDGYVREVKKRGVGVDPNQLRQMLPRRGSRPLSLILLPLNGTRRALIARRLPDG